MFFKREIIEPIHGKHHLNTASSYNNIGVVYDCQGNYNEALNYYLKTLEIREATLGKNHSETADIYNNIGGVYVYQEKYDEAYKYFFECLEIKEATLGKNDPSTQATSYIVSELKIKLNI